MNEIEKMYENAGIGMHHSLNISTNSFVDFYPFTSEKQLELIKWLAKIGIKIDKVNDEFTFSIFGIISDFSSFEESLANLINNIWKNLTDDEKQQVKRILE